MARLPWSTSGLRRSRSRRRSWHHAREINIAVPCSTAKKTQTLTAKNAKGTQRARRNAGCFGWCLGGLCGPSSRTLRFKIFSATAAVQTLLRPQPRRIVRHAERQQDCQPEERGDYHDLGELFVRVLHVHEKQDDESRLDGGDGQCHYRVEGPKIDAGRNHGEQGASQQGEPDADVQL